MLGDTSIQELNIRTGIRSPRESEFRNTFDWEKGITPPAGYDVYYWNSTEDIDYAGKTADDVVNELTWSTTPSENTKGIRIVAQEGVVLQPNQRLDVVVPMIAPENTQNNNFDLTGKKAYNTFVRKDNATLRFLGPIGSTMNCWLPMVPLPLPSGHRTVS